MPTNPYNPHGTQWSDNRLVQGRVSQEDFFWLKSKFPHSHKLIDQLVSTLFKKVIDELRKIDRETPFGPSFYLTESIIGSVQLLSDVSLLAGQRILEDALSRLTFVERRSVGEDSSGGPTPTQHDAGGVDGIRAEMQRPTEQRAVKKGRTKTGKRSAKGPKKKEE